MLDILSAELSIQLGVLLVSNENSTINSRDVKISVFGDSNTGSIISCKETANTTPLSRGIRIVRLDGSMSLQQRKWVLDKFSRDPSVRIMLISLRAGGVGLNLTDADCVILTDAWWNPSVEDQAIDRVHRLGQLRELRVYRLICTNSVESKMLLLQVLMYCPNCLESLL